MFPVGRQSTDIDLDEFCKWAIFSRWPLVTIGRLNWHLFLLSVLEWKKLCWNGNTFNVDQWPGFPAFQAGYFLFCGSVLYISQSDKCQSELRHWMVTCLVWKYCFHIALKIIKSYPVCMGSSYWMPLANSATPIKAEKKTVQFM